ncbi:MAG: hypothetical protein ACTHJT_07650 [Cytophaga sp.]|uniref:hypothetical protein n=1 Tax=Cytophaga sp. TaxID=29535 RepID=UPI003F818172
MIHIASPCDADWQKMHPEGQGKFCSSCEKVVVDFSKMSDAEIKNYFTAYKDQKTCGRFLTSQVDRPLQVPVKTGIRTRFNTIPVFRSVAIVLASSFLWLSSCVKKQTTLGEPSVQDPDCNEQIMGDTVAVPIPEDTTALEPDKDTIQFLKGEVAEPQEIYMGKVRMTDTISRRIKRRK